jgi:hypothetical protein
VNGALLGEAIATAAVGQALLEDMKDAYARAMARLVVIKLVASLPPGVFSNFAAADGAFATGGAFSVPAQAHASPFAAPVPEFVVPLRRPWERPAATKLEAGSAEAGSAEGGKGRYPDAGMGLGS